MEKPSLPRTIHPKARKFWHEILNHFDLDVEGLQLLNVAVQCLSDFHKASRKIEVEGSTYTTKNGLVKRHPLCEIQKDARIGFLISMKQLNLNFGSDPKAGPGRPLERWS